MSNQAAYQSLEEAWADCLGETMPTAEDVAADPMQSLKAMYMAGAIAALQIAYHHGFADVREEVSRWCGEGRT